MADSPTVPAARALPARRLEPDAIGIAQYTVIGMASSAPAGAVVATLASLAAATAYGSGPIIVLTAIPMLIIANALRWLLDPETQLPAPQLSGGMQSAFWANLYTVATVIYG